MTRLSFSEAANYCWWSRSTRKGKDIYFSLARSAWVWCQGTRKGIPLLYTLAYIVGVSPCGYPGTTLTVEPHILLLCYSLSIPLSLFLQLNSRVYMVAMLPIWLFVKLVNQRLPSGPLVIP